MFTFQSGVAWEWGCEFMRWAGLIHALLNTCCTCEVWTNSVASFPGSHTLEHEHWRCAGVESLVFSRMSTVRGTTCRKILIEHGHTCTWRLRTWRRAKIVGNLLYASSYRKGGEYYTLNVEHVVGWTCKTLPSCSKNSSPTSIMSREKKY